MEALFYKPSQTNDLNETVLQKWSQINNEPFTLKIKPEFIIVNKKIEPVIAAEKSNSEGPVDNGSTDLNENNKKPAEEETSENGHKSKKIKKSSRKEERKKIQESRENRLCSLIARCENCQYGEQCRYSHDVDKWLETKPADISANCYLFEKLGRCPFGISCRFGSCHIRRISENVYENLVKPNDSNDSVCRVYNVLGSELRTKLWKRQYDFSLSNRIVKKVDQLVNESWGKDGLKYNRNKGTLQKKTQTNDDSSNKEEIVEANETQEPSRRLGALIDDDLIKLRTGEKKKIDWKNKLYLAPLTTVGNLPYRRICKELGADITCCEMAMSSNLLMGQASEWALLKRHETEDLFGIQLAGAYPDQLTKACQIIKENLKVDFVDINCGCPIDLVFDKGAGCALMTRLDHFHKIVSSVDTMLDVPLTVKLRTGIKEDVFIAHELVTQIKHWGVSMITLHGRTRQQRYSKLADWEYINKCAKLSDPIPLFGCGDILSHQDYYEHMSEGSSISGCMIARGALYKPWVFTEIKERRDWDISAAERLDILKKFVNYGLEHWGSDNQGVETTRRFLLEWLSFLYRYVPIGLLESLPQRINLRPPFFFGRNELESLMASPSCSDWIKISEFLLGPVPNGFNFNPKHKANAY